ncbi:MAG TPA: hypothetical protein DCP75_16940 [Haliea salexigens]|uniref:DUF2165 domain-containing protein n=1 Tax=Haliea salexigens TaxID=287487 RepID=A0A3C1KRP4_9GAMM|nr:hypothetical protein [Haliea sp.]HAN29372.1 hypothetical protein [Haliea salexigens]|tara:strand:+ start:3456 stop:3947 length:492 start_codon:yes stop_codon:yes gene_type:complete
MLRSLKIATAAFVALLGLLHVVGNLANLEAAMGFVGVVTAGGEQPFYRLFGPPAMSGILHGLALALILLGELTVAGLALAAVLMMLRSRSAEPHLFAVATRPAVAACAVGMLLWFGIFIIVGEGYFMLWQSEAGAGPIAGAMRYGTVCGMFMLFLLLAPDTDR